MSVSPARRSNAAAAGGALFMVLCCAIGPAVIGAAAGSAIGGWLGITCTVVLTTIAALLLYRHDYRRGSG